MQERISRWLAIAWLTVTCATPTLRFVCHESHDLLTVANERAKTTVHSSLTLALDAASVGDGLLVLAAQRPSVPGTPQRNTSVNITAAQLSIIQSKRLRTFIEFPGVDPISGRDLQVQQTEWERIVVSKALSPLAALDLLHPHKYVDFVQLPAAWLPFSSLLLCKVAGYSRATLGLPQSNRTWPMLATPSDDLMIAATQLSRARTRRFSPSARWYAVFDQILNFTSSGTWQNRAATAVWAPGDAREPARRGPPATLWTPRVAASFPRDGALPASAASDALIRGVDWFHRARLLPSGVHIWGGSGQLGVLEGLGSTMNFDGTQPQATGLRNDCTSEVSASFAARGVLLGNASDRQIATNLLNFAYVHSGFSQPWALQSGAKLHAERPWLAAGDAFGLMAWTTADKAYELFYKDDNARSLLATLATAGLLRSDKWHSSLATAALANLRETPACGFGPPSADFADLKANTIFDSSCSGGAEYSPHYQSYQWAVYLWAFNASGFSPFYERAFRAIEMMMAGYPSKWVPTSNGIAMQRARMLLPLAWLVRVNDTALHRSWLHTIYDGLAALRRCGGDGGVTSGAASDHAQMLWCTYEEELSAPGWGGSTRVPNNDDYGTFESPLNQENGDPVSDMLYTTNFAMLGLHEAAAATGNTTLRDAADRLADFLIRAQARSAELPQIDGAFYRAFDFQMWEVWASDADTGWGAWSVETGWTQSWLTTLLGLRALNTNVWKLGGEMPSIRADFEQWIPLLFPGVPSTTTRTRV